MRLLLVLLVLVLGAAPALPQQTLDAMGPRDLLVVLGANAGIT